MSPNAQGVRIDQDAVPRLGPAARVLLAAACLSVAVGFWEARRLEPDPRGFGTHLQMGLPPCAFLKVTGLPCPSCGLTTSFSWMVRGRFDSAWRANPAGTLLAPASALIAVWCGLAALSARPPFSKSVEVPLTIVAVGGVSVCLLVWSLRLLIRRLS